MVLRANGELNVDKPEGVTPYGGRKKDEQRNALRGRAQPAMSAASPKTVPGAHVHVVGQVDEFPREQVEALEQQEQASKT